MRVHNLRRRIIRKSLQSPCRHKIVAVGLDSTGTVINLTTNRHRFMSTGGGYHAEERLLFTSPPCLTTILIARVRGDRFLPIHPCSRCSRLAGKRNVVIVPLEH